MSTTRASIGWSFGICVAALLSHSNGDEIATEFVVHHAEKAGESGDVPLTEAGRRRAEKLADVLSSYGLFC